MPDKDGVRPLVRCLLLQRCVSKPRDRSAASRHENEPRHREVCTLAGKETDGKQVSQEHRFLDDDKGFEKKEAGEKEVILGRGVRGCCGFHSRAGSRDGRDSPCWWIQQE